MIVLDTHIWVWWVHEDEQLTQAQREGEMPTALQRWAGPNVADDRQVHAEIKAFIQEHKAKSVVITDGVIGCPHEEGIDYPLGEDCPFCPFWKGKQ